MHISLCFAPPISDYCWILLLLVLIPYPHISIFHIAIKFIRSDRQAVAYVKIQGPSRRISTWRTCQAGRRL